MARRLGPLLPLLLVGLLVLHHQAQARAAGRIAAGETRAVAVLDTLARRSEQAAARDAPHPGLHALLGPDDGLEALAIDDPSAQFARDRSYMYGLARLTERAPDSDRIVHDWILRAWPLAFGETGDAEFQVGSDGVLWEGQNLRGRSGLETGFPPPFPDPDLADDDGRGRRGSRKWWPRARPAQR